MAGEPGHPQCPGPTCCGWGDLPSSPGHHLQSCPHCWGALGSGTLQPPQRVLTTAKGGVLGDVSWPAGQSRKAPRENAFWKHWVREVKLVSLLPDSPEPQVSSPAGGYRQQFSNLSFFPGTTPHILTSPLANSPHNWEGGSSKETLGQKRAGTAPAPSPPETLCGNSAVSSLWASVSPSVTWEPPCPAAPRSSLV